MYNVLLLGSAIDTGGAERVIANLTRYVDRSVFNVTPCHLVRPRGTIGDELVRDGYEVLDVGRSEQGIHRYLSFRSLRRIVRSCGNKFAPCPHTRRSCSGHRSCNSGRRHTASRSVRCRACRRHRWDRTW